jgi:hypothetical protein
VIVLDEMMQRWNGRWQMHGETSRCRQCYVAQWPSSAEQPVEHEPTARRPRMSILGVI